MIIFNNKGLIPMDAVRTMGLNVKVEKDAIGHFGTGLKYAIAVLLREGCSVTLYRGTTRHVFGLKKKSIRGKSFQFVTMGEEQLAFTTELGKDWEVWQAFRELWCNTMDESGTIEQHVSAPKRAPGHTMIVVSGDPITAAYNDRHSTVLIGTPDFKLQGVEVLNRKAQHIYYRGIRALDNANGRPSLWTYNVTSQQTLTEDRTLKYDWSVKADLARAVLGSKDAAFLREYLTAKDTYMEHYMSLDVAGLVPSELLLTVLASNRGALSEAAKALWDSGRIQSSGHSSTRVVVGLSTVHEAIVEQAKNLCEKAGYPVPYETRFVASLPGNDVLELKEDVMTYSIGILEQGHAYFAVHMLCAMLTREGQATAKHQLAAIVLGVELPKRASL